MRKIICWLFGHNWSVYWPEAIRFQKGMETFRYKHCTRCSKTIRFDIEKAEKPLPPIDCNQKVVWNSWYNVYDPSTLKLKEMRDE